MAGVVNPASPEGMLRSYYGGDATGLSSVKDKPEDDRSILEQVRNYLIKGINKDARYVLGEHAAPAVTGLGSLLGELLGPGADVRDAVTASKETAQAVKEGDILGAGVGGLNTLASIAMMALPGSLSGVKKVTDNIFSRKPDAIGNTEAATDTFASIPIPMTPKRYASLVPEEKLNPENIKFLTKKLEEGKDIAPPQMTLQWDGKKFVPTGGQEGRHRMKAVENLYGDKEVPVTVKLLNEKGNKIPVEELQGTRKFYTVKDSEEAEAMLQSLNEFKKMTDKALSPLRRLFEDLSEETKQTLPKQPSKTGLYGYHGSSKGRVEKEGEDYFDIKFGNPNDQFMGEGFYFTINPKVAEEYANLRSNKDFQPIRKADPRRPGKMKDTGEYINPKTKEKATTASLMEGVDIAGKPLLGGQNISRFNLENIEKPYVIKNNKQRLYAKENIDKLKEEGYDSILFKDFDDRSQQILVFPEHIGKVSGDTIKETVTKKSKGGSVVERNPYANYQSKAI
jgi:hypothetical protein